MFILTYQISNSDKECFYRLILCNLINLNKINMIMIFWQLTYRYKLLSIHILI